MVKFSSYLFVIEVLKLLAESFYPLSVTVTPNVNVCLCSTSVPAKTTQLATLARIQVGSKVASGAPPVGFPVLALHAVSFLMREDSERSRDIPVIWTWHVC